MFFKNKELAEAQERIKDLEKEKSKLEFLVEYHQKASSINYWVASAKANAEDKGFYDSLKSWPKEAAVMTLLALIHTEVSEAVEDVRSGKSLDSFYYEDGKPVGFASELADIALRLFTLCGFLGVDLESAIKAKQQHNATRPYLHKKKF